MCADTYKNRNQSYILCFNLIFLHFPFILQQIKLKQNSSNSNKKKIFKISKPTLSFTFYMLGFLNLVDMIDFTVRVFLIKY